MASALDDKLSSNEEISYTFKNRCFIRNVAGSALAMILLCFFSIEVREVFLRNLLFMISLIYFVYFLSSALFCSIYVLRIVSFKEYTEIYFANGMRNELHFLMTIRKNGFYENLVIFVLCHFLIYPTFWGVELNTRALEEIKKAD